METLGDGIGSGGESDKEREEEAQEAAALLRDRLRLSVISIASSHAKTLGMTISEPVVACIADLAFKQAEQMGRDVELFAQHAGRKSVNTEDVILSGEVTGVMKVNCYQIQWRFKTGRVLEVLDRAIVG